MFGYTCTQIPLLKLGVWTCTNPYPENPPILKPEVAIQKMAPSVLNSDIFLSVWRF